MASNFISYYFEAKDRFSKEIDKMDRNLKKFNRTMVVAKANMKAFERMEKKMGDGAVKAAKKIDKIQTAAKKLEKHGKKFAKFVSLPIAAGFGFGLRTAAKFEAKMINVKSILHTTSKEMEPLIARAREIARVSPFTPAEVAGGMALLSRAGLSTTEILQSTEHVLNLAVAGLTDMDTATGLTASVLKSFNIDASKTRDVVDMLAQTASKSNTDVALLRESFKTVGTVASSLKIDLKQVSAGLMVMADAGRRGSDAGTGLKNLYLTLSMKSKVLAGAFKVMGIQAFDANGNITDFQAALGGLLRLYEAQAKKGKGAEFLKNLFPDKRAQVAFRTFLVSGMGAYNKALGTLGDRHGRAKQMAEEHMKGVVGAMKTLKSALADLSIQIFDPEVLAIIANWINKIARAINGLTSKHPILRKMLAWGAAFVMVLGVIAAHTWKIVVVMRVLGLKGFGVFGLLRRGAIGLTAALVRMVPILASIRGLFGFIGLAVLPIIVGVKGLVDALNQLKNSQGILKSLKTIFSHTESFRMGKEMLAKKGRDIAFNIRHPLDAIGSHLTHLFGGSPTTPVAPIVPTVSPQSGVSGNANLNINVSSDANTSVQTSLANKTGMGMAVGKMRSGGIH